MTFIRQKFERCSIPKNSLSSVFVTTTVRKMPQWPLVSFTKCRTTTVHDQPSQKGGSQSRWGHIAVLPVHYGRPYPWRIAKYYGSSHPLTPTVSLATSSGVVPSSSARSALAPAASSSRITLTFPWRAALQQATRRQMWFKLLCAGFETCDAPPPTHTHHHYRRCWDPMAKHIPNPDFAPFETGGEGGVML